MKFIEIEKYKVKCILEESEMFAYGATLDDILSRKPGTFEFIRLIKQEVMKATSYNWRGCAFSSQIEITDDGKLAITFSETIDDFVYNLKQTMVIRSNPNMSIKKVSRVGRPFPLTELVGFAEPRRKNGSLNHFCLRPAH